MQIPGLSAPIPPGAQFGYQPGGWGKPPVDEEGNPLYGDVFGLTMEPDDDEPVRCQAFVPQAKPCISHSPKHLHLAWDAQPGMDSKCIACYQVRK